jgi:aspartate/methionine/tyrosine aminotransferase
MFGWTWDICQVGITRSKFDFLLEPLNNGLSFFEEALKERVIFVPGIFFDINPGKRRELFRSPYHHFVRMSFGPPLDDLKKGMDSLERLIIKFRVSKTSTQTEENGNGKKLVFQ